MTVIHTKWVNWVIPGLLAVTQFSIAAENNFADDILPDVDSVIEIEQSDQQQEIIPEEETSGIDADDNNDLSPMIDIQPIRFGSGYEYRQSLRPEVIERPDIPERPQIPERPELPGRFGR